MGNLSFHVLRKLHKPLPQASDPLTKSISVCDYRVQHKPEHHLSTALSKVQKETKPALSAFLIALDLFSFLSVFKLSVVTSLITLLTQFPLTKPAHLSLQHVHPDGQLSSILTLPLHQSARTLLSLLGSQSKDKCSNRN